jgi:anionic cell wall polymer biosynthesis LytR-Cps2A-Psr (LCP) family protein
MRIKSSSDKGNASVLLLVVIFLFLAGGIVFAVFSLQSDPVSDVLANEQVISVLYIIEKDEKPFCTFVMLYHPTTRKTAIFDIPGDVWVLIRSLNRFDRMDTSYNSKNISAFQSEVERLLNLTIAFSIVIDIENLGKAIDLIEGVELFIPSRIAVHEENNLVLFPSGINRFDGAKAVAYLIYSSPYEDREMKIFRRQRLFLAFLRRQSEMNEAFNNRTVAQMYLSFMQTGLNQRAKFRLLNEFTKIDFNRSIIQSVGGGCAGNIRANGAPARF